MPDERFIFNNPGFGKPVSAGGGGSDPTKQPLDADLTAIAGLSPSNDDVLQRKASAWTNRTITQLKTDLGLVKGDVGLGNVDNTSDANKPVSTATQTALDAKVAGVASSVDSEIMLFNGTGGKTAKRATQTGILVGNAGVVSAITDSAGLAAAISDEIGTGKLLFSDPVINRQTGTSYTLQASDNGKIIECENASAITVTVPTSLGGGFNCVVIQLGAGQVTLNPSSTTLRNKNGLKTSGQYAALTILPTNTANTFLVSGDTSA